MAVPASALERFDTLYEGPDEHLGERVVCAFLTAWEGMPEESEPLMATLRGAMVNDQALEQLRDFIQARLLADTSERPVSNAALRAGLATSLLIGMVVCRRIIGVPFLVAASPDELVTLIAPAIQQVLVPPPAGASFKEARNARTGPVAAYPAATARATRARTPRRT